jgi:hypothetical protein
LIREALGLARVGGLPDGQDGVLVTECGCRRGQWRRRSVLPLARRASARSVALTRRALLNRPDDLTLIYLGGV